jgi:hypothetical protein
MPGHSRSRPFPQQRLPRGGSRGILLRGVASTLGNRTLRSCLLVLFLAFGCAHVECAPFTAAGLAANYWNGDPWSPRTLRLRPDGSFDYLQFSDNLGPDDKKNGGFSFRGRWAFRPPDCIELDADPGHLTIRLYVRFAMGKVVVLEPDLYPDICSHLDERHALEYLTMRGPKEPFPLQR